MTKLSKPVTRETLARQHGVPIVVELWPRHIDLRVKGDRNCVRISYEAVFKAARKVEPALR